MGMSARNQYNSLYRVWREVFDTDASNDVTWFEFVAGCKTLAFNDDIGGCWRAFDEDGGGSVGLEEFDPPSYEVLVQFKRFALRKYGGIRMALTPFRRLNHETQKM